MTKLSLIRSVPRLTMYTLPARRMVLSPSPSKSITSRPTTWNVGKLRSDNPQNILSPEVSFRLYFRTTFASDSLILKALEGICPAGTEVEALGGDDPLHYFSEVPGIPGRPMAFGSDAPRLRHFARRAICGPGSILTAHTDREQVRLSELETAVEQYIRIFKSVNNSKSI